MGGLLGALRGRGKQRPQSTPPFPWHLDAEGDVTQESGTVAKGICPRASLGKKEKETNYVARLYLAILTARNWTPTLSEPWACGTWLPHVAWPRGSAMWLMFWVTFPQGK